MAALTKEFRRQLQSAVIKARKEAERGAATALEAYGVGDARKPTHLDKSGEDLRRKLRAHGRQNGDMRRDDDSQETEHLIHECAYEHWHRMLFARFLAENGLLIEPESGLDVDMAYCEERARETQADKWEIAAGFTQTMLPAIFRPDDPVLNLRLPMESRNRLIKILSSLPREIFLADDSLGWVYQFWQAKKKKEVSASGEKAGADELAPLTQLFTEDYMVEFLLHNTLGAWWTAKRSAEGKKQLIDFAYLRLNEDGAPAAGAFENWPREAKHLRVLDPCMGSGHFLVTALMILVRMRSEEEGLCASDACVAVLRDNLFGLELDSRCTQLAAFNLALASWKLGGHHFGLKVNVACAGLRLSAKKKDWLKIAAGDRNMRFAMGSLFALFEQAPELGSLINPRRGKATMYSGKWDDLQFLLQHALQREETDDGYELAIAAQGAAKAAQMLGSQFNLVATNVPYLARGKQNAVLKAYCESVYPNSKANLATAFIERSVEFLGENATAALVVPRAWTTYTAYYKRLRYHLLTHCRFDVIALIGAHGFETISGEVVDVALISISRNAQPCEQMSLFIDASKGMNPGDKAAALKSQRSLTIPQQTFVQNPGHTIALENEGASAHLSQFVDCYEGLSRGDVERFDRQFWELPYVDFTSWQPMVSSGTCAGVSTGMDVIIRWDGGSGDLASSEGARVQGDRAWNRQSVFVSRTHLNACLSHGQIHAQNGVALVPKEPDLLLPVLLFCGSEEYRNAVTALNQKLIRPTGVMTRVPFDLAKWRKIAAEKYPNGLPEAASPDPAQWFFDGHPRGSNQPLHVAVARLLGYRWPRLSGSSLLDCPKLDADGLEKHADKDGVVCLSQTRGEPAAVERLQALLADAYGKDWDYSLERKLIADTGSDAQSLEEWLLHDFFAQHCDLFHHRPFVWHLWDGRRDGFNALVSYHKLAGPQSIGARTLDSLTYAYLGDWIARQRHALKTKEPGAEDRLSSALELQQQLKCIIAGEPPYDLFVRWKSLAAQPVGWQPDLDDGVRINCRPFRLAKLSRGRVGAGLFRRKFNLKWSNDGGKEIFKPKEEFPWLWSWDGRKVDFSGRSKFDGVRWYTCHYSRAYKTKARKAA